MPPSSKRASRPSFPGPNTRRTLAELRRYESRNVTFLAPDGSWPIVWQRARGMRVWDVDGRCYLDLTAAFGVAAAGHANPRVVRAGQRQMTALLHAMGDVHPHPWKAQLARALSRLTFERWTRAAGEKVSARPSPRPIQAKTIFGNSGFEAVEAALKTARLATGKPGIIAFEQAYHGLGYGALNATYRGLFRDPFRGQLAEFGHFLPFPTRAAEMPVLRRAWRDLLRREEIGAVLVEPVQGRGGVRIPPPEFLPWLRSVCTTHGCLLILDEIYTGLGRTGRWFACEHTRTVPDLICLGKALTGGFPLSACVGRADVMDRAWPASTGEAIHTSTFLGHPVGCAMALAQIEEIWRRRLVTRSARLGRWLTRRWARWRGPAGWRIEARNMGLMAGLELRRTSGEPATDLALATVQRLLSQGFILLPEGEASHVLSLTPPLIVSERQLEACLAACEQSILRLTESQGRGK